MLSSLFPGLCPNLTSAQAEFSPVTVVLIYFKLHPDQFIQTVMIITAPAVNLLAHIILPTLNHLSAERYLTGTACCPYEAEAVAAHSFKTN